MNVTCAGFSSAFSQRRRVAAVTCDFEKKVTEFSLAERNAISLWRTARRFRWSRNTYVNPIGGRSPKPGPPDPGPPKIAHMMEPHGVKVTPQSASKSWWSEKQAFGCDRNRLRQARAGKRRGRKPTRRSSQLLEERPSRRQREGGRLRPAERIRSRSVGERRSGLERGHRRGATNYLLTASRRIRLELGSCSNPPGFRIRFSREVPTRSATVVVRSGAWRNRNPLPQGKLVESFAGRRLHGSSVHNMPGGWAKRYENFRGRKHAFSSASIRARQHQRSESRRRGSNRLGRLREILGVIPAGTASAAGQDRRAGAGRGAARYG